MGEEGRKEKKKVPLFTEGGAYKTIKYESKEEEQYQKKMLRLHNTLG